MKQNCIKTVAISLLVTLSLSINASTRKVNVARSVMVGNGIAKFVPDGFDAKKVPSFAIEKEPREQGALSSGWELVPDFSLTDGKANASLIIPEGTSIYGGGEVTGSLLRNGKTIKLWNTDSGAYGVDNGTRLYQSHPWMMGVRKDGTGLFFQGNVVTSEESKKFFAGNNFYTTAANRMARNYFPNAVTVEDVVKAINQTEEEAVSC